MDKKRVKKELVIIGGGIGGTYLANGLQNKVDWILLEKSRSLGGSIDHTFYRGSMIPKGPRMFMCDKNHALVKWASDYQVRASTVNPKLQRYLLTQRGLQSVGPSILFKHPEILYKFLFSKKNQHEESFAEFFKARIGKELTEELIDPIAGGIWAGDIEKLSLDALWGKIKHESLFKRLFMKKKRALYVFEGGLKTLIDRTYEKWIDRICLNTEVLKITPFKGGVRVETGEVIYEAQKCVIATSFSAMKVLSETSDLPGWQLLGSMKTESLKVVNFYFEHKQKRPSGIGYLIPSVRGFKTRGVLFDTDFNPGIFGEVLSCFIQGSSNPVEDAYLELQKVFPDIDLYEKAFVNDYPDAIFQCHVGDETRLDVWRKNLEPSGIYLVGAYLPHVGVVDVLEKADQVLGKLENARLFLTEESLIC